MEHVSSHTHHCIRSWILHTTHILFLLTLVHSLGLIKHWIWKHERGTHLKKSLLYHKTYFLYYIFILTQNALHAARRRAALGSCLLITSRWKIETTYATLKSRSVVDTTWSDVFWSSINSVFKWPPDLFNNLG